MALYLKGAKEKFEAKWEKPVQGNAKLTDFDVMKVFGEGGFGRVALVRHKESTIIYAMKMLNKESIVRKKVVESTLMEKKILQAISFPFIVELFYSFKDFENLYLILEFIPGGDIFFHLQKHGKFSEHLAKFYVAQVVLAFEYMHHLNIVYRDLKPENVMLDALGYAKVTDLGFAKVVKSRTYTFCGTPFYLAPEILHNKGYSVGVDWWTLGVLIFELDSGNPPFDADEDIKIFEKIVSGHYKCPGHFSSELKDLISHLLQTDMSKRFGILKNGVNDIKSHNWFKGLDWGALYEKKIPPLYKPELKGDMDTSNFENVEQQAKKGPKPKTSFSTQFAAF